MTKEEWKQTENALRSVLNIVKLNIDGYDVQVKLERVSIYKNALAIYVDGKFKGEWLLNDCEERRRFVYVKKKALFSNQKLEKMRKELKMTKRELEKFKSEHNTQYNYFQMHWPSFASLKKHLIANNSDIQLVEII